MSMGTLLWGCLITMVVAVAQVRANPLFNLFGGGNNGDNDNDGGCRSGYEYITETTYETSYEQQCK